MMSLPEAFLWRDAAGEPRRWVDSASLEEETWELGSHSFSGKGPMKVIEIQAPDGDRSVMVITTGVL